MLFASVLLAIWSTLLTLERSRSTSLTSTSSFLSSFDSFFLVTSSSSFRCTCDVSDSLMQFVGLNCYLDLLNFLELFTIIPIRNDYDSLATIILFASSVRFVWLPLFIIRTYANRISYTSTFRSVLPAAILSFQAPIPRPHDQSLSSGTTQIESPALPRSNDVLTSFPSLT